MVNSVEAPPISTTMVVPSTVTGLPWRRAMRELLLRATTRVARHPWLRAHVQQLGGIGGHTAGSSAGDGQLGTMVMNQRCVPGDHCHGSLDGSGESNRVDRRFTESGDVTSRASSLPAASTINKLVELEPISIAASAVEACLVHQCAVASSRRATHDDRIGVTHQPIGVVRMQTLDTTTVPATPPYGVGPV